MSAIVLRTVQNRDGTNVSVSDIPEKWWSENFVSGFVDPRQLAPDPDQPRKNLLPLRLEELYESIDELGVREPITVTPRHCAPWARVEKEYEEAFFLIVSGHRRWNGAKRAALGVVPIRVVIYANEADHREDAAVLNDIRENLNEVEQGYEFVRLRSLNRTIRQLESTFGMNAMQIYNRINLTKLHPDIQVLVLPNAGKRRLLSVTAAGILGGIDDPSPTKLKELFETFAGIVGYDEIVPEADLASLNAKERRFAMQKLFVAIIRRRNLNAVRSVELIRDQTLVSNNAGRHVEKKVRRFEPHRRKDILETLCKTVSDSLVADWPAEEFRRIFENASREEIEPYLKQITNARQILEGIEKYVAIIWKVKQPTRPEVINLMARRKQTS